jgi:hypothetical protein
MAGEDLRVEGVREEKAETAWHARGLRDAAGCQQSASNSASHSLASRVLAFVALPVYLRRQRGRDGQGVGHMGEAKSSHGRGHRFDPCHAHQPKRFPVPTPRAVCQKICQKIMGLGVVERGQPGSIQPIGEPANSRALCSRAVWSLPR